MKSKNVFGIVTVFVIISVTSVFAQPNWTRVNYETSTVFTGYVSVNGMNANVNDLVGIFVNDECRMVSRIIMVNDTSFVSAVIHSAGIPETAVIKYWDSNSNTIYTLDTLVAVQNHGTVKRFPIEIKSEEEPTKIDIKVEEQLEIYPLPFTNTITVESSKAIKHISLYNSIGEKLVSQAKDDTMITTLHANNLTSGLYLLHLEFSDGTVVTKKVFKK